MTEKHCKSCIGYVVTCFGDPEKPACAEYVKDPYWEDTWGE